MSLQASPLPVQLEAISRALMQLTMEGAPGEQDAVRLSPIIDRIGAAAGQNTLADCVTAYAYLLHELAAQAEQNLCEASREGHIPDPISEGD